MDLNETEPFSEEYACPLSGTLAGRFVIGERIGKGGMGEVYRAEDSKLKRTVAIKRIGPRFRNNPIYHSRLMKEAQHASILSDPHIAAVYDVFNENSECFLVMEFIEGKSLRDYVNGTISIEDFRSIATQSVEGLATAHRQGIVHRDVKPENIMVTSDKQVKICDFGLARLTPQQGADLATVTQGLSGTPGYMAPEVHLGSTLDPRSDVFSLGMVLFELWTGRRPFTEKSFRESPSVSPQPSSVRPGLDSQLDKIIQRMLSFSPAGRFADATQALEELKRVNAPSTESKSISKRRFVPMLVLLGIVVGLAAIATRFMNPSIPAVNTPASVLLADFDNKTGDPYYDLTASQLFSFAMEQSQYLNVTSRYRVSEALGRSKLPPGTTVTLPVALGIAKQEGAKFVVSGEVTRQSGKNAVTVRVNDAASGKQIKVFTAGFGEAPELPPAVQSLTRQTREWLGEPLTKINQTNVALDQATTRSAIAWERFSRAVRTESLGGKYLPDAVALLKSAVEIDPDFAMAHELLSTMQSRLGNLQGSLASMQRAFDLSGRVTDREKYTIIGEYHNVRYEFDLALQALRTLLVFYPYDDVGQRYYAQVLSNALAKDEAIAAARTAVALNPESTLNKGTLNIVLALANRNDEVISIMNAQRQKGVQSIDPSEGNAWLAKGDFVRAREIFEKIAGQPEAQGNSGRLQLAKTLIYEGKLDEAAAGLEADLSRDLQLADQRLAVQRRNWLGWIRALQGDRAAAAALARTLLQATVSPIHVRDLRGTGVMLAEIGEIRLAEQVLNRLEGFVQSGFQGNVFSGAVAHIKGEIARARGQKELARQELDRASLAWVDVLTLWSDARLSEDTGDFQRARTAYREMLSREGETIRSHFPGLKSLALAGVARCESSLGNHEEARKYYDQFFTTLGKYSPDLMVVKAARHQRDLSRVN